MPKGFGRTFSKRLSVLTARSLSVTAKSSGTPEVVPEKNAPSILINNTEAVEDQYADAEGEEEEVEEEEGEEEEDSESVSICRQSYALKEIF